MKVQSNRRERGYSLIEILTVVAIIGILSLISVPAFMNYQRSAQFKSALRAMMNDLRGARQLAISQSFDVRVEFQQGSTAAQGYRFFSSRDNGTTWAELRFSGTKGVTPGSLGNWKFMEGPVYIDSSTGLPDIGANSQPDIVFHPNGTIDFAGGATTAVIRLRTQNDNLAFNRFTITLSPSGQMKSAGDKV